MKNSVFLISLVIALSYNLSFSQTDGSPKSFQFLIEGGLEYGGDEIAEIIFTNGGDQTMRAGQGGYIAVGGQLEIPSVQQLMLRGTIGLKYNTTAADNANIRLTRLPVNVLAYFKASDDIRVGLGVTSHQAVKFRGDGFLPDADLSSSVGPRVEVGYKWVALTYTSVNYSDNTNQTFSANSLGLSISHAF